MGKFFVRITIILTSIYFITSHIVAQFYGVDILTDWYIVPFIFIVVVYSYTEGKYHCKHIKHLALSIFLSDLVVRLDNYYNFLTVNELFLISFVVLLLGFVISTFSAVNHFRKVNKIKRMRKKNEHSNNERNTIVSN